MNNLAINKRLAELAGQCWHEWKYKGLTVLSHEAFWQCECGSHYITINKNILPVKFNKKYDDNTNYTDPANLSALSALVEKLGYKYNLGHLWGETKYFGVIYVVRDRNNDDIISHWGNSNESLNHALALALIAAEKENK